MSVFKAGGLSAVLSAVIRRLRTPHARCFPSCQDVVRNAIGLEIGGPSPVFARGGLLPLYPVAERVDNATFARTTIWADAASEGELFWFHPGKRPGRRLIAEGADLRGLPNGAYDFVLSSHMLEHTANPLRALAEWSRLLKVGGALVVVLPHRDGTFDHRRPVTTLTHLVEDFDKGTGEDDRTHLPEIIQLHDLARDPGVTGVEEFRDRAHRNAEFRSLHHHVFDTRVAVSMVGHAGFELLAVEPLLPYHIFLLARKPGADSQAMAPAEHLLAAALRISPFASDHAGS